MKVNLLLIFCFLSSEAFSQGEISNPAYNVGPHPESLALPSQSNRNNGVINSGAIDYNHYDLNQNSYSGGKRDIAELDGVIPTSEKYSYKEFIDGNLIYGSGNQSQVVKMNYHLLYREMQFIDEKGDTLFITNTDSIAFVRFDKTLYMHSYQSGYYKILSGNDHIKLCSQQKLKLHTERFASSKTYNIPYQHLVLSKKEDYYLVDKEVTYEATKTGFQNAFPKFKQQIEIYLQQMARKRTPIKFYKEADLIALLNFCTSLL